MSSFDEWVRAVLDARLLAERHRDPLLLPLINTLEKTGEAFKGEPEYEVVMKILEEARKLLDSTAATATATASTTSTSSTGVGGVLLEAVVRGGTVTVPAAVVREHDLRPGEAIIRLGVGREVVQYRTRLYRINDSSTLRFFIPIDIRRKFNITDGARVVVIGIVQGDLGKYRVRRGRVVYIPAEDARRLGLKPGPALVRIGVGKSIIGFTTRLYRGSSRGSTALKFIIPSDIAHKFNIKPGSEVVIHSIRNL